MKKIIMISILIILSITNLKAQTDKPEFPIDSLTGKILYTDVIEIDSLTSSKKLFSSNRK